MSVDATKGCRNRLEIGVWALGLVLSSMGSTACDPAHVDLGETCQLATDCRAPFVCRLGSCRQECREVRDCRAGLLCVRDELGLGVCQQPLETMCLLASQCPDSLVCRFGNCTNVCEMDRDCPSGALCVTSDEGSGCVDPSDTECELNSDCGPNLICARDQRCRPECVTTRDCRDGRVCDMAAMPRLCVPPGTIDGGGMDGGVMTDGGMVSDAGTMAVTPPPPTFTAGGNTGCTVVGTTLRCFGANGYGQVGSGAASAMPSLPTAVSLTGPVLALGMGSEHVCAFTDALYCWGRNTSRQLGAGSTNMLEAVPRAVSSAVPGVVSLGLGAAHTCAIGSAGLSCWGDNTEGQLCDGTMTQRPAPRAITVTGTPVHVVAGAYHTCVLFQDAHVECCGRNDQGQLGVGDRLPHNTLTRSSATDVVRLVAGDDHVCVVGRAGAVRCWGDNLSGQIGTGSTSMDSDPMVVAGIGVTRELALGFLHTCSLSSTGGVFCWGDDGSGQVGVSPIPFPSPEVPTPRRVTSLASPVTELRAGRYSTCALLDMGAGTTSTWCFGDNTLGAFGDMGAGGPTPREVMW